MQRFQARENMHGIPSAVKRATDSKRGKTCHGFQHSMSKRGKTCNGFQARENMSRIPSAGKHATDSKHGKTHIRERGKKQKNYATIQFPF